MKACFRLPAADDDRRTASAVEAERAAALAALADGFEATVRDLHAANHALRTRLAAVDELATAAVGQVRHRSFCRSFCCFSSGSHLMTGTGICWARSLGVTSDGPR
jgi:hypothetical protein